MGNRLYKRSARITAYRAVPGTPGGFISYHPSYFDTLPNATVITDLRVVCKIEKSIDHEPNTCEVKISNAAESTRSDLIVKPLIVRIEAGYDDNLRHVYTGDLRYGYSTIKDATWNTVLYLGDGDRAYRYARVSRSYKKGTSVLVALREAAESMGLILDSKTLASDDLQQQFASGHVLHGAARDELTRLLARFGYHWSIQDGRMQILRDDETRADQAFLIDEDAGMIDSPEMSAPDQSGKPPTLQVKVLLYPELTPGAQIQVRARSIDGLFRIEKLTHTFGTASDDDWQTEIEARPV